MSQGSGHLEYLEHPNDFRHNTVLESSGCCLHLLYISLGPMQFADCLGDSPVQSTDILAAGIPDHDMNKKHG